MAIDISQKKNVMYIKYNFDLANLGKDNLEEMISLLRVNGNLKGRYSQIDGFRV